MEITRKPDPTLSWNLRQLYWDIFWFGVLAGSTITFMAVYAARLGATGFQIGLLSAGPAIINLIFTMPSGMWLVGRSLIRVSYRSALWQRLGYVIMVALPWLFGTSKGQIWGMIWITITMSVAGTVLAISFNSMFAEVLPSEWRAHAVARRNILLAISLTLTTLASGYILDKVVFPVNYQIVFLIGAMGAMLSSFHLGRIRKTENMTLPTKPAVTGLINAGRKYKLGSLFRLDLLTGSFGLFMLSYLAFYTFQYFPQPLFPLAYVEQLHLSDGEIGIGTAMFYGTMVLASFRLNYLSARYGHRKLLIASAALFPVFPLLLGFAHGPGLYYLACLIGGVAYALLTGALINRLMDRVPAGDRPGHMAVHNLALNVGILAGSLLGPVFAGLIGLQLSMFLGAGLRFLSAVLFFFWG